MGTRGQEVGICCVVSFEVRPSARDEAARLLHADANLSRKEEGVSRLDFWHCAQQPGRMALVGHFASDKALEAHMQSEHVKAWWAFQQAGNVSGMDRNVLRPVNMQGKTKPLGSGAPACAILTMRVKADRRADFDREAEGIVRDIRTADDTLHLDLMRSVDEENKFVMLGIWRDEEAMARQHQGPVCGRLQELEAAGCFEEPIKRSTYQAANFAPAE